MKLFKHHCAVVKDSLMETKECLYCGCIRMGEFCSQIALHGTLDRSITSKEFGCDVICGCHEFLNLALHTTQHSLVLTGKGT